MSNASHRLVIVSSISDSCGNAAFTEILRDSIERFTPTRVDVAELNLALTQSTDKTFRNAAMRHVQELCERLREAADDQVQNEPES